MAKPDLKVLNLLCPHRTCGAAMVQDECGIFCRVCGYEAITWADPVDADVPMNILVARENAQARRRLLMRGAVAAAALIALMATAWFLWPVIAPKARGGDRDIATVTFGEMQTALANRKFPDGVALPAFYSNPDLFFLKQERQSQSTLITWWGQRSLGEKLSLLDQVKDLEDPFVLPLLFEICYFTAAQEQELRVAISMTEALYLCSEGYLDIARFVCDHIANATTIPEAQVHATRFVADLDDRRRRIGY